VRNKRLFTTSAIALALQISTSLQLMAMDDVDSTKAGVTQKAPAGVSAAAASESPTPWGSAGGPAIVGVKASVPAGATAAAVVEGTTASGSASGASAAAGLVDAGDDVVVEGVYKKAMVAYREALTKQKTALEAARDAAQVLVEEQMSIFRDLSTEFANLDYQQNVIEGLLLYKPSKEHGEVECQADAWDKNQGKKLSAAVMKALSQSPEFRSAITPGDVSKLLTPWTLLYERQTVGIADLSEQRRAAIEKLEAYLAGEEFPKISKMIRDRMPQVLQKFKDAQGKILLLGKLDAIHPRVTALVDAPATAAAAPAAAAGSAAALPAGAKAKK
jgi:hypothetical protein